MERERIRRGVTPAFRVTQEMVEAGVAALNRWHDDAMIDGNGYFEYSPWGEKEVQLVTSVFLAMWTEISNNSITPEMIYEAERLLDKSGATECSRCSWRTGPSPYHTDLVSDMIYAALSAKEWISDSSD